jgi:hypothetical protein
LIRQAASVIVPPSASTPQGTRESAMNAACRRARHAWRPHLPPGPRYVATSAPSPTPSRSPCGISRTFGGAAAYPSTWQMIAANHPPDLRLGL